MTAPAPEARRAGRLVASGLVVLATVGPFLLLTLLVTRQWGPLARLDDRVERTAHEAVLDSGALLSAARATTLLGGGAVRAALVLLVAAWLLHRRQRRHAVFLVLTVAGGSALNIGLKALVDRARPVLPEAVAVETSPSFPSGHTMGTTVLVLSLLLVAWPALGRWRPGAVVFAGLAVAAVAASRVLLGVHYLSDVVAAVFAGGIWVAVSAAAVLGWRGDRAPRPPRDPGARGGS